MLKWLECVAEGMNYLLRRARDKGGNCRNSSVENNMRDAFVQLWEQSHPTVREQRYKLMPSGGTPNPKKPKLSSKDDELVEEFIVAPLDLGYIPKRKVARNSDDLADESLEMENAEDVQDNILSDEFA